MLGKSHDKKVEEALFKRATGYTQIVKKPVKVKTVSYFDNGKKAEEVEKIEFVEEEQIVEPNISAISFYLKGRCPKKWGSVEDMEDVEVNIKVID